MYETTYIDGFCVGYYSPKSSHGMRLSKPAKENTPNPVFTSFDPEYTTFGRAKVLS